MWICNGRSQHIVIWNWNDEKKKMKNKNLYITSKIMSALGICWSIFCFFFLCIFANYFSLFLTYTPLRSSFPFLFAPYTYTQRKAVQRGIVIESKEENSLNRKFSPWLFCTSFSILAFALNFFFFHLFISLSYAQPP